MSTTRLPKTPPAMSNIVYVASYIHTHTSATSQVYTQTINTTLMQIKQIQRNTIT